MSAVKSGSTLRGLILTPERIPSFFIPSPSPRLFLSPRLHRSSPDRTRLLSDPDDSPGGSPENRISPAASPRFLLRLPPRIRAPRRAAASATEEADTDLTTRAAMSLPHVEKVTTPYGFRAVLAASPCTHRRESLFHRNKPVTVTVTEPDQQDPDLQDPVDPPPPDKGPSRSRIPRPVKALGLQVMKELKKPAAALKALSPAARRTDTR
ncbi:C2 calcium-dependent domain-containing protein 4C-like [Thunnus maccoyii]|uniref:C2 calcium-dependent domain-containing protein 4C-like n=1 Tax=Thunnus maccoyii TaxID=8240 RepID=UPI001C4B9A7E|nr:C2 calcium-dependent domain-containing protein 4C-like [Thunnus maccoyii]XP_042291860.1 C2 calcium-dependent domain-containing protein 4C-like [Thunnus maccoyii]